MPAGSLRRLRLHCVLQIPEPECGAAIKKCKPASLQKRICPEHALLSAALLQIHASQPRRKGGYAGCS
eukprot:UN3782